MAVPDFQAFMRPILIHISDGQQQTTSELYSRLASHFSLSQSDLDELLPSGKQLKYHNRILWAKFHLSKAEALDTPRRGVIKITDVGRNLLGTFPEQISMRELLTVPAYAEFTHRTRGDSSKVRLNTNSPAIGQEPVPPDEQIDALYAELNVNLADELLSQVERLTPSQFERLVVQLLVAMGYGGSVKDAGAALGRSGDDGVDGVIKQDSLGLDKIYLQAKRWQKKQSIGSSEIRNFIGSLNIKKADKGVFITTSVFTPNAIETVRQTSNATIILIDGETLSALMIEHGVGVIIQSTYLVRRIDNEFFEEI